MDLPRYEGGGGRLSCPTITTLLSAAIDPERCEATAFPFWMIIDPRRVRMSPVDQRINEIASAVTGPFFSRESAEEFLFNTHYNFSTHATVYCMSGHNSHDWRDLLHIAKAEVAA